MLGLGKEKQPEYVVICREFNRAARKIEVSIIESGVTEHLLQSLIRLGAHDTHRRYFLTTKKDYQKYGALFRKQVETMSVKSSRRIVELGTGMRERKGR